MAIKIFITDDHEIFRDGIRALLIGSSIQVIADFSTAQALLERLPQQQPDLLLLDISMPQMSGIEALEVLQAEYPDLPVLMLSADTEEQRIHEAIQKGAKGFLPKDCSREELIKGIESVAKGQAYFGSNVLGAVFNGYVKQAQPKGAALLSERELDIVRLLCDGLSYKAIGEQLFISPRTVESHKQAIFKKLDLTNNAQLIKYAIKHQLISLD